MRTLAGVAIQMREPRPDVLLLPVMASHPPKRRPFLWLVGHNQTGTLCWGDDAAGAGWGWEPRSEGLPRGSP